MPQRSRRFAVARCAGAILLGALAGCSAGAPTQGPAVSPPGTFTTSSSVAATSAVQPLVTTAPARSRIPTPTPTRRTIRSVTAPSPTPSPSASSTTRAKRLLTDPTGAKCTRDRMSAGGYCYQGKTSGEIQAEHADKQRRCEASGRQWVLDSCLGPDYRQQKANCLSNGGVWRRKSCTFGPGDPEPQDEQNSSQKECPAAGGTWVEGRGCRMPDGSYAG